MKTIALLLLLSVNAFAVTDREIVAAVLVAEAGCDGEVGLRCVMEVVNTRSFQRGLSHVQVVKQRKQFSVLNGVSPSALVAKSSQHRLWPVALWIASNPVTTRYTGGANHFESVHFKTPRWAHGRTEVAIVGQHRFFHL